MKNECDIVKDLLNSYDEGILSETSKKFVENHLTGCENCKQILKKRKSNIEKVLPVKAFRHIFCNKKMIGKI